MTYDTDTDTDAATDTESQAAALRPGADGRSDDPVAVDGAARGLTRRDGTKPDGRRLSVYSLEGDA